MSERKGAIVKIKKDELNPEPEEVIAKAIIDVAEGFKRMQRSRLSRRAVVLLIQDSTGAKRSDIEAVLTAATELEQRYIKKRPEKP